jgi:ubiquinone/menaquinone biosynthesis C-methylase UbiE
VIGTDISREAIAFAKNNYTNQGLHFSVGDIFQMSFSSDFFNVVVCLETIEHLRKNDSVLWELRRVVKRQGLLVLSSPNRKVTSPGKHREDQPNNPFHQKEYSKQELVDLVSNHFHDIDVCGQRGVNRLLYLPFLKNVLRRTLPRLYRPEYGSPIVEKIKPHLEYRYLIALCKGPRS